MVDFACAAARAPARGALPLPYSRAPSCVVLTDVWTPEPQARDTRRFFSTGFMSLLFLLQLVFKLKATYSFSVQFRRIILTPFISLCLYLCFILHDIKHDLP